MTRIIVLVSAYFTLRAIGFQFEWTNLPTDKDVAVVAYAALAIGLLSFDLAGRKS